MEKMQNDKQRNKNISNKNTRNKQTRNFLIIVGAIVGTFLLIAAMGVFVYVTVMSNETAHASDGTQPEKTSGQAIAVAQTQEQSGFIANLLLPPEKTNFVIMGVDKGEALTDVIIVGSFDRETQKITLISIPRDTYFQISDAGKSELKDMGRSAPSVVKINSLHSYAGTKNGADFLRNRLEEMMGVEIDYYAEINLKAFRNIVTAIGGVEMDIPAGGLYDEDPKQNLVISVPGGRQLLDADMAEGVVRYRKTYKNGDLQRIGVQQEFMKQLFKQVMDKDTLINNAGSFLTTIISYVRTDFGIQDIPQYLRYVSELNTENLELHTLPGEARDIGDASYFIHDQSAMEELVQQVFYSTPEAEPEEDAVPEQTATPEPTASPEPTATPVPGIALSELKKLKMQVLNGTDTSGLAAATSERLKNDGFNVSDIGDYGGTKQSDTRVVARKSGIAVGFKNYFKAVQEVIDPSLPSEYDIIIILGTSEKS